MAALNNGPVIYTYPIRKIDTSDDYLEIQVLEYQSSLQGALNNPNYQLSTDIPNATQQYQNVTAKAYIHLPIPQSIRDENSVTWGESSLNSLAAAAVTQGVDAIKSSDFGPAIAGLLTKVLGGVNNLSKSGNVQQAVATGFAAAAVNQLGGNIDPSEILTRATGQIINPNTELLFKTVNLRSFNFDFDLTPRDSSEALVIKKIIRAFKQNSSAKTDATTLGAAKGLFISSPNVFQLAYKQGAQPHPFLNAFKPAALTRMSVDYSGGNAYATYEDATPVHMRLSLSFQELNPIYFNDYNNLTDADGVGY